MDTTTLFTYNLPPERIAQRPVEPRDSAKMIVVNRSTSAVSDSVFFNLTQFLKPGDALILNNTTVRRARLCGHVGERAVELLVLTDQGGADDSAVFRCMGRPLKKLTPGVRIQFEQSLVATVLERVSDYEILCSFESNQGELASVMNQVGLMPIPPYIRAGRSDWQDLVDYQTVFSSPDALGQSGRSVAAPTAGLHFTVGLIDRIKAAGVAVTFVTLEVGPASFLALWSEGQELRKPGAELYRFDPAMLECCSAIRKDGGRVIAVGTTTVRALESMARECAGHSTGQLVPTELFIAPGFEFRIVDGLITNFHQPQTTHLLLVEALIGKALLKQSYDFALNNDYRFLSYGDGMLII